MLVTPGVHQLIHQFRGRESIDIFQFIECRLVALEQIAYFIENKYGLGSLNNLLGSMSDWEGQEETAGQFQQTEESLYQELSGMLTDNELELPAEDNPLTVLWSLPAAGD